MVATFAILEMENLPADEQDQIRKNFETIEKNEKYIQDLKYQIHKNEQLIKQLS